MILAMHPARAGEAFKVDASRLKRAERDCRGDVSLEFKREGIHVDRSLFAQTGALLIAAVGVGASTLGAAVTNADMMQTFELSNFNAGDASNPLDATITFDFSVAAKNLTITIDNTTPSTYSAGELIRSVGFSLASVTAPASLNNVAMVGDERTVAGNGSFTDSAELVNARLTSPWTFNPNGGGYTLSAAGSKDLVIGPANANSQYSGNGSIDGNHGHNPFLTSAPALRSICQVLRRVARWRATILWLAMAQVA